MSTDQRVTVTSSRQTVFIGCRDGGTSVKYQNDFEMNLSDSRISSKTELGKFIGRWTGSDIGLE